MNRNSKKAIQEESFQHNDKPKIKDDSAFAKPVANSSTKGKNGSSNYTNSTSCISSLEVPKLCMKNTKIVSSQGRTRRNGIMTVVEVVEQRDKRRDAVCATTDTFVEERTVVRVILKKF